MDSARYHELGLLHGHVNKHNFVVSQDGGEVKLVDSKYFRADVTEEQRKHEIVGSRARPEGYMKKGFEVVLEELWFQTDTESR